MGLLNLKKNRNVNFNKTINFRYFHEFYDIDIFCNVLQLKKLSDYVYWFNSQ